MAFVCDEFCAVCKKVTQHCNSKCGVCFEREERMRIAAWNAQTDGEKLQDLRRRVEALERGPVRF